MIVIIISHSKLIEKRGFVRCVNCKPRLNLIKCYDAFSSLQNQQHYNGPELHVHDVWRTAFNIPQCNAVVVYKSLTSQTFPWHTLPLFPSALSSHSRRNAGGDHLRSTLLLTMIASFLHPTVSFLETFTSLWCCDSV